MKYATINNVKLLSNYYYYLENEKTMTAYLK